MNQILEMYTCTMHNEVMSDKLGKCPKYAMTLAKQKMMKEGIYTKSEN